MDHLASTSSSADTTISQDVSLASSLPSEILSQIFSYVQYQDSLFACSLTCRSWYESAVPELYKHPQIVGPNFDAFVKAICPSKNAHIRRNGLAELVRVLDMARLIHHSRRSLTARLLSRTKYDLECFIAPQASFGINSLSSLSKCIKLRVLNLSWVTEAIPTRSIFKSTLRLPALRVLYLPNAYTPDQELSKHMLNNASTINDLSDNNQYIDDILPLIQHSDTRENNVRLYSLPSDLEALYLAGSMDNAKTFALRNLPITIHTIGITSCQRVDLLVLFRMLQYAKAKITKLIIGPNVGNSNSRTHWDELGPTGGPLAHLRYLTLEYREVAKLSPGTFEELNHSSTYTETKDPPGLLPRLQVLTITAWDPHEVEKQILMPSDVVSLIRMGDLPLLRLVRVDKKLGWHILDRPKRILSPFPKVKELDNLLKEKAETDEERRQRGEPEFDKTDLKISKTEAGVVFITTNPGISRYTL